MDVFVLFAYKAFAVVILFGTCVHKFVYLVLGCHFSKIVTRLQIIYGCPNHSMLPEHRKAIFTCAIFLRLGGDIVFGVRIFYSISIYAATQPIPPASDDRELLQG